MNHIIGKILNRRLNVDVYTNNSYAYELLQWNTRYTARPNVNDEKKFFSFIFYFKEASVNVQSYDIMTHNSNVFPTNWTISVSNDNVSWVLIDRKDEPLCSPEYFRLIGDKYYCTFMETKYYQLKYPNKGYYQYVKFQMLENSYYGIHNWHDTFAINGFELNGDFFMSIRKIRTRQCKNFIHHFYFATFLMYC